MIGCRCSAKGDGRLSGLLNHSVACWIASLALLALPASASKSYAQQTERQVGARITDTREVPQSEEEYRLTMPVLRKMLAVKGPHISDALPPDTARWMSVKELTAALDRIPAARQAIASAGLSTAQFAAAWKAYAEAEEYLMQEELAKTMDARAPVPLHDGVRKDNVELIRANQKEVKRLEDARE
jgi:hypothetical protein